MNRGDTITAIATPPGPGGIGVVRLSGPDAHAIVTAVFEAERGCPEIRKVCLGKIVDRGKGFTLDRCLLTLFKAPNSYTGEDLAEFSCHGSLPVLRRLLEILADNGARPALKGEFTLRAVLNGRLDLAQAEAVNRLVRAGTLEQAAEAVMHLEGEVSKLAARIDNSLMDVVSRMEASVDFAEEGEEFLHRDEAVKILAQVDRLLTETLFGFRKADLLRDGAVAVIAGATNVGKSTLFNALLQRRRAIVDHRPGTTRDYIAETIDLDGVPLTLIDTAGLRAGVEDVEIEGMRRTEEKLGEADLIVLVTECCRELTNDEAVLLERLRRGGREVLLVKNKADLLDETGNRNTAQEELQISALKGEGIRKLTEKIKERLGAEDQAARGSLITELRQQQLFRETAEAVSRARAQLDMGAFDEVVLEELNAALESVGRITGKKTTDDILERIFADFCIGK
jgi:tRNA modification GTPase